MWTGSLDSTGSPTLKISVAGFSPKFFQEFEAIIDTGFTGFLSMPLTNAISLGLILWGTTTVILADGKTGFRLTAYGTATVEGQSQGGVAIIEWNSSEVLIGMDFLRKFEKTLMIHTNRPFVLLEDCAIVDAAMATRPVPAAPTGDAPVTVSQESSVHNVAVDIPPAEAEVKKSNS